MGDARRVSVLPCSINPPSCWIIDVGQGRYHVRTYQLGVSGQVQVYEVRLLIYLSMMYVWIMVIQTRLKSSAPDIDNAIRSGQVRSPSQFSCAPWRPWDSWEAITPTWGELAAPSPVASQFPEAVCCQPAGTYLANRGAPRRRRHGPSHPYAGR